MVFGLIPDYPLYRSDIGSNPLSELEPDKRIAILHRAWRRCVRPTK